jgi:hypothetical protein
VRGENDAQASGAAGRGGLRCPSGFIYRAAIAYLLGKAGSVGYGRHDVLLMPVAMAFGELP